MPRLTSSGSYATNNPTFGTSTAIQVGVCDLLTVLVSFQSPSLTGLSDSAGVGAYTRNNPPNIISGNNYLSLFYKYGNPNPNGGTMTFTISDANIYASIYVQGWKGVRTDVDPFVQQVDGVRDNVSSTTVSASSALVPRNSGNLIVSGFWPYVETSIAAMSVDSGLVITDKLPYGGAGASYGGAFGYRMAGAAPITPTWTVPDAQIYLQMLACEFLALPHEGEVGDGMGRSERWT